MSTSLDHIDSAREAQQVVTKACDVCRKKKIRCEPTLAGCAQCTRFKTRCHFTPIAKKKKHRNPPGYRQIAKLEERLQEVEGHLKNVIEKRAAQGNDLSLDEGTKASMSTGDVVMGEQGDPSLQQSWFSPPDLSSTETDVMNNRLTESLSTSSVSPFISVDTPRPDVAIMDEPVPSHLQNSSSWKGSLVLGPFSLPTFHELPPSSIALSLVNEAFSYFFDFYPLFDRQDFLVQFHQHYETSSPNSPAWWACINAVLAFAHQFRAMLNMESIANAQSCGYIHNALAVVSELNLLQNSLPAVQALVSMALILQGTPNPHSASVFIAAAIRLAHSMGLHLKVLDSSLTDIQCEQRRRVFWIAYFLDKDISLRTGQPFAQDDDDMDADLPSETPLGMPLCGAVGGDSEAPVRNIFNYRIGLAVLQGQIYKKLYSVQAVRLSMAHKAIAAQELNNLLSYWRASVPVNLEDMASPQNAPTVEFVHLLVLRFNYVHCLVMIDRQLPLQEQFHINATFATQGSAVLSAPESTCVTECRKAIALIQAIPLANHAFIWILLNPVFQAVSLLLNHVLGNPASPHALSDLHAVEPFIQLLETLATDNRRCSLSEEARRMLEICNDLNDRARLATGETPMIESS